ncbi:hypothetical protein YASMINEVIRUS_139 [Yasminevirus sp. GU-2018]|uniref:Uncharacterized protein n=1 Tax=Yasminevirus sp. GU-2018 TaxID=2420051 RepID=A0A5K0U976_9VIRU|nr:hypothetical protein YASMINEVIRUS_139 [Yasminevirus sp. GU-2018]
MEDLNDSTKMTSAVKRCALCVYDMKFEDVVTCLKTFFNDTTNVELHLFTFDQAHIDNINGILIGNHNGQIFYHRCTKDDRESSSIVMYEELANTEEANGYIFDGVVVCSADLFDLVSILFLENIVASLMQNRYIKNLVDKRGALNIFSHDNFGIINYVNNYRKFTNFDRVLKHILLRHDVAIKTHMDRSIYFFINRADEYTPYSKGDVLNRIKKISDVSSLLCLTENGCQHIKDLYDDDNLNITHRILL